MPGTWWLLLISLLFRRNDMSSSSSPSAKTPLDFDDRSSSSGSRAAAELAALTRSGVSTAVGPSSFAPTQSPSAAAAAAAAVAAARDADPYVPEPLVYAIENESFTTKFLNKAADNPFVPLGECKHDVHTATRLGLTLHHLVPCGQDAP